MEPQSSPICTGAIPRHTVLRDLCGGAAMRGGLSPCLAVSAAPGPPRPGQSCQGRGPRWGPFPHGDRVTERCGRGVSGTCVSCTARTARHTPRGGPRVVESVLRRRWLAGVSEEDRTIIYLRVPKRGIQMLCRGALLIAVLSRVRSNTGTRGMRVPLRLVPTYLQYMCPRECGETYTQATCKPKGWYLAIVRRGATVGRRL